MGKTFTMFWVYSTSQKEEPIMAIFCSCAK